jgi:hypothetical protein
MYGSGQPYVYDRMYGSLPAKITVYTPFIQKLHVCMVVANCRHDVHGQAAP